jgi:hypothetical protein
MTDDLVTQLRWLGDHASFEPHMHHTAADRIEKLEAALREVLSWVDQYSVDATYDDHWPAIEELARKALENKNG